MPESEALLLCDGPGLLLLVESAADWDENRVEGKLWVDNGEEGRDSKLKS
jgi:hypothetical protein